MASSKSPEAAVEDGKGPTASARCTIVAPGPAAGPCRAGLPAALVEVMLSDLPPSPATAAAPAGSASACGASKMAGARRVPSGCSLTKEELHAPHELGAALY